MEEPDPPAMGFTVKAPEAPVGKPLTVKLTSPLNPFEGVTVTVEATGCPGAIDCEAGVAASEKSGRDGLPHEGNLNEAIRVLQLNVPSVFRYSLVYQKVQSSTGSILM